MSRTNKIPNTLVEVELYPKLPLLYLMKPTLINKVSWISDRHGNPTKCQFTVMKDDTINFPLGTKVIVKVAGKPIFLGFVFYKHRTKDRYIECTAYDQLRYLKLKMSKVIQNHTASETVKEIVDNNNLQIGAIDESLTFKTPTWIAEDKECLEIIDTVSAQHTVGTGEVMILYDDAGEICYRKLEDMKISDQIFNTAEMEDFDYTTSIDKSYNSIAVDVMGGDNDNKVLQTIIKEDTDRISYWGLLRFYAKSNEAAGTITRKAENLLKLLNRETRELTLKNCLGNVNVRGGSLIAVRLYLGDMELFNWMIVRDVTHTIDSNGYLMDIKVENPALGFNDAINPEGIFKMLQKEKSAAAGGGRLPGNTNAEKIWNALADLGYSTAARAGILGNMSRETGGTFNPAIRQADYGGGPGMGLCQWEKGSYDGGSGRWDILVQWCHDNGLNELTVEGQCAYLDYELTNGAAASLFQHYTGISGGQFKQIEDVDQATAMFLQGYEIGPPSQFQSNLNKALGPARTFYEQWKDYGKVGTGSAPAALMQAINSTGWPGADLCATWVSRVFSKIVGFYPTGNGNDMTRQWCHSNNLEELRPGMVIGCIVSPWSAKYGHIAIYARDDTIYSSERSGVEQRSVNQFINMYGPANGGSTVMWGWLGNVALS